MFDNPSATLPASYYEGMGGVGEAKMVRMPTMQERLDKAVSDAEFKLAQIKEARDIFKRNPDIEKLLNIMQRSIF